MSGAGGQTVGRLGDDIRLPLANAILVQTVTVAAVIDLAGPSAAPPLEQSAAFPANIPQAGMAPQALTSAASPSVDAGLGQANTGWLGHWIDITVDAGGGDLGYNAGPTTGSVSGANAPVLATTGAMGTAGTCLRIAAGTFRTYYATFNERFLGVVSSAGNCTVRIALSSR